MNRSDPADRHKVPEITGGQYIPHITPHFDPDNAQARNDSPAPGSSTCRQHKMLPVPSATITACARSRT